MTSRHRLRRQQIIRQAEGYLELGMSQHALDLLALLGDELSDHGFYLQGEALRSMGRNSEAIVPLRQAAEGAPSNIHAWLALGWCQKRVGRLDLAIEALEEALEAEPREAIVHYNLACYWSLAGNKRQALLFLAQALELDGDFRDMIADESDFDAIRNDSAFQTLATVIV